MVMVNFASVTRCSGNNCGQSIEVIGAWKWTSRNPENLKSHLYFLRTCFHSCEQSRFGLSVLISATTDVIILNVKSQLYPDSDKITCE